MLRFGYLFGGFGTNGCEKLIQVFDISVQFARLITSGLIFQCSLKCFARWVSPGFFEMSFLF